VKPIFNISLHLQAFNKELLQILVVSMPTTYRGNMSKKLHPQGHRSVQTLWACYISSSVRKASQTSSARKHLYPRLLPTSSWEQCKNVSRVDSVLPLFPKNTMSVAFVLNICFCMPWMNQCFTDSEFVPFIWVCTSVLKLFLTTLG
jgi:hypothetical protein